MGLNWDKDYCKSRRQPEKGSGWRGMSCKDMPRLRDPPGGS